MGRADETDELTPRGGHHRLLTRAEEIRLARRIEQGDAAAKDELIMRNLGLVRTVATRFRGRGVGFDDLVQEGTVGLVRAVERFDHRRGVKFSTYAVWWIRRSLIDALDTARPIRIPPAARQQIAAIQSAQSELRRRGPTTPTTDEISQCTGLSAQTVRALDSAPYVGASLDEPVGSETTTLGELIADAAQPDVPQRVEDREIRAQLLSLLRLLPARQREILLRRYGLRGDDPESHEEIGAQFGVGEERSRQIERQALHRLRAIAADAHLVA
jgi:RNA polymerase primary sigma factor